MPQPAGTLAVGFGELLGINMKLQTFITEVVNQIRAGAKAGKGYPPDIIHMEISMNEKGEVCSQYETPTVKLEVSVGVGA